MNRTVKRFDDSIRRGLDYTHRMRDASEELMERKDELQDLLKVPSLVSLSGLALVLHGSSRLETLAGVNEVAAGRSFDLFDGFLARALSQETDMGAVVDATCDKIGMTAILTQGWRKEVIPKPVVGIVMGSNVFNAGMTGAAALRHPHKKYETPPTGKHSMALFNAGVISYAYASAFEREHYGLRIHTPLRVLGAAAISAGVVNALPAAAEYVKRAVAPLETS